MKVHTMKQGGPEWSAIRLGKVTASEADALVSPEGKIRTGEGPRSYLYRKLCEKLLGYRPDSGSTFAMDNGSLAETIAIPWYCFTYDTEVQRVGFCESDDGRYGSSPDGLVGEDGGLEIKFPTPPVHLSYLMDGVVPKQYVVQNQFNLYVTKRKWWDFVSFSRQLPNLVVRVTPDEGMQCAIHFTLAKFCARFDEIHAKIVAQKEAEEAPMKAAYEEKMRRWEQTGIAP